MAVEHLHSEHWDIDVFPVGVKLRFHDLRHVFASVMLQLGGDSALKFVQRNRSGTTSGMTRFSAWGSWRPELDAQSSVYFALAKQFAEITRRCRLNDLRHTFANNLASDGCNLLIIRDALGHTTTRMSERYAKPSAAALEIMRATLNRRAAAASSRTTRGTTQAANE
jgi:integrase